MQLVLFIFQKEHLFFTLAVSLASLDPVKSPFPVLYSSSALPLLHISSCSHSLGQTCITDGALTHRARACLTPKSSFFDSREHYVPSKYGALIQQFLFAIILQK